MFTRIMRDNGLDYYWLDKFHPNVFASGFEADPSGEIRYELLTAFELCERCFTPASRKKEKAVILRRRSPTAALLTHGVYCVR